MLLVSTDIDSSVARDYGIFLSDLMIIENGKHAKERKTQKEWKHSLICGFIRNIFTWNSNGKERTKELLSEFTLNSITF